MALNPKLIVCDEPVSALDLSVQAQVLNLLVRLQRELGISYLFISHDLSVVRHLAHSTVVMYLGRIVAKSQSRNFWKSPLHPYVIALKQSTPTMDVLNDGHVPEQALEGEIPSPLDPPRGCHFSTRCPQAIEVCRSTYPPLRVVTSLEWVACHRVDRTADGVVSTPWGGAHESDSPPRSVDSANTLAHAG